MGILAVDLGKVKSVVSSTARIDRHNERPSLPRSLELGREHGQPHCHSRMSRGPRDAATSGTPNERSDRRSGRSNPLPRDRPGFIEVSGPPVYAHDSEFAVS